MNPVHLIFAWCLASSVRASLLALAVVCVQLALSRWLPARWRYVLWLPVILVLVAPILPATRWSVENCFVQAPSLASDAPSSPIAALPSIAVAQSDAVPPGSAPSSGPSRRDLMLAAWLLGASGMLAAGGIGYWRTLRRLCTNQVETGARLADAIESAAEQIGLARLPRVLVSTAVESPAVAGLLRPMLLLPGDFPEGFTDEEARLILLHELTHLKAWDLPLNWLLCLMQALHWFNPLLWLAFARIRADREAACDARVLSADSKDRRADYGQALLKLQGIAPRFGLSVAFVGMFEQAGIRFRIRAIGRHRTAHPVWGAVAIAVIGGLLLAGATRAETEESQPLARGQDKAAEIEVGCRVVEVPAGLPIHLNGEKASETTGKKTQQSGWTPSANDVEAFFKQISEMKDASIISSPMVTTLSGRRAVISVGDNWQASPNSKPILLGESFDINPKIMGKNVLMDVTFTQTKLVNMRMVPARKTGGGSSEVSETDTAILQTTASDVGNATGMLTLSATARRIELVETDVKPNTANEPGDPPWSKGVISAVVSSKVAIKDGETLVLTKPVAGFPSRRLLIFITPRIINPAGNHDLGYPMIRTLPAF